MFLSCASVDPRLNGRSIGEVVPIEQAQTLRGIEVARELREEVRMFERAVQVDQEARDSVRKERDSMAPFE
jgi:hypothetical protein